MERRRGRDLFQLGTLVCVQNERDQNSSEDKKDGHIPFKRDKEVFTSKGKSERKQVYWQDEKKRAKAQTGILNRGIKSCDYFFNAQEGKRSGRHDQTSRDLKGKRIVGRGQQERGCHPNSSAPNTDIVSQCWTTNSIWGGQRPRHELRKRSSTRAHKVWGDRYNPKGNFDNRYAFKVHPPKKSIAIPVHRVPVHSRGSKGTKAHLWTSLRGWKLNFRKNNGVRTKP